MDTPTQPIFEDFIVTCWTEDCENYGIELEVPIDISGMLIFCGPCELPIEDIVPVADKV